MNLEIVELIKKNSEMLDKMNLDQSENVIACAHNLDLVRQINYKLNEYSDSEQVEIIEILKRNLDNDYNHMSKILENQKNR